MDIAKVHQYSWLTYYFNFFLLKILVYSMSYYISFTQKNCKILISSFFHNIFLLFIKIDASLAPLISGITFKIPLAHFVRISLTPIPEPLLQCSPSASKTALASYLLAPRSQHHDQQGSFSIPRNALFLNATLSFRLHLHSHLHVILKSLISILGCSIVLQIPVPTGLLITGVLHLFHHYNLRLL